MTNIGPIETAALGRVEREARSTQRTTPDLADPVVRRGDDRVEVSDVARYLSKLKEVPAVRTELVQEVRAQIEAGTFETPERLEGAAEQLLEDLGLDL